MIDENFSFDPPLVLAIGSPTGPEFEREGRMLRLPYTYLTDLLRAYDQLEEDREAALRAALDALEYSLYLLLGQALADRVDVENDAEAEALATWAMVSHWPNGGEQWLDAIDAFGTLGQRSDGTLEQFWHRHALYAKRERELRCLAFGSNPARLADRMPAVADEAERAARCTSAWRRLRREARGSVERLLRQGAPLASEP